MNAMGLFKFFHPSDHERRKTSRIPFELIICYQNPKGAAEEDGEDIYVKCLDISSGGLLFVSTDQFDEGSLLTVQIPIPGNTKALETRVEVIRVRQMDKGHFEMGVKFSALSGEDHVAVEKLVACYKRNTDLSI